MKKTILALVFAMLVGLSSCLEFEHSYRVVAPGIWRGELTLHAGAPEIHRRRDAALSQRAERGDIVLPFLFEVFNPAPDSVYIEIINGKERIPVREVSHRQNPETKRQVLSLHFPVYDTYIEAEVDGGKMDGFWYVPSRGNYKIPFSARLGKVHRFEDLRQQPVMDISGLWQARFGSGDDGFEAVGVFQQEGNQVHGTFMTNTGDFRFLAGHIQGDRLALSTFDGSHAFLFEAKIRSVDSTMTGAFYSGSHYQTTWEARKDPSARLDDPESQVRYDPNRPVRLRLPRPDGDTLDIENTDLAGRPKIIQIMGTWCPNCRDEGVFLAEYLRAHPDLPVEIFGVAFEKSGDPAKAFPRIKQYRRALHAPYPIAFGGKAERKRIFEVFPQLDNFVAYPTMLFLDAQNRIVAVHTGFNGPATPAYTAFKTHFGDLVKKLTAGALKPQNSDK